MFAPAVFRAIKNGDIHQPQSNEWTGVKNSKVIRLETGWFLASNMFGFQPSMFPSSTSCLGANASKGYCPVFIIGFPSSAVEIPVYRSWVIYVTLLVFGIGHCSSGVGGKTSPVVSKCPWGRKMATPIQIVIVLGSEHVRNHQHFWLPHIQYIVQYNVWLGKISPFQDCKAGTLWQTNSLLSKIVIYSWFTHTKSPWWRPSL